MSLLLEPITSWGEWPVSCLSWTLQREPCRLQTFDKGWYGKNQSWEASERPSQKAKGLGKPETSGQRSVGHVTPYVSTPSQIRTLSKLNIFMCMSYWTTYFFYSSVVQKNLVFVVGLSPRLSDAEVLRKHEYFGKFGKIHKVVINTSTAYAGNQNQVPELKVFPLIQRLVSLFNIDPS